MPVKNDIEYFDQAISPVTGAPAAYRVAIWLYEADGQYHAEAPELELKVSGDRQASVYTALASQIGKLRNNNGKPKPLVLKKIEKEAPEGAMKRLLNVS